MRPAPLPALLSALLPLAACSGGAVETTGRLASNDDPGYSASGAEVIETGPDGAPRYRLRAERIRQDPATGAVALERVDMTVARGGEGRWRVQAARGSLPAGARSVGLEGDVRLEGESLLLRTAALDYDLDRNRVTAPGEVRFEMSGRSLEATGLEADLDRRQAKFGSRVHGRFVP